MTAPKLRVVPPAGPVPRAKLDTAADRIAHFRDALERQQLSPKTINTYANHVALAEFWCGEQGYSLRNVPSVVFAQYVEARLKTYPSRLVLRATMTQYWTVFKRKDPPLWLIRVPKRPRMICRALSEQEAVTLAAKARARGDREGLAVLIAMYQGFRREEISAMRWDDITDDGWLKVMGKGTQPAKVPLNPIIAELLAATPRHPSGWVFPGRRRGSHVPHVSPTTVWQWVCDVAADAGLEGVSTHRLRHTCLAAANDATGDLRAVQDFARHAKVDTTAGYTRTTARRLIAVMQSIDYSPDAAETAEREQRLAAKMKRLTAEQVPVVEAVLDELLG